MDKIKKQIKHYLLYPIKYLLKGRVAFYKNELEKIKLNQKIYSAKQRRIGMSNIVNKLILREIYLEIKYKKFIDKWSL